jgi:hypothetical protein
VGGRVWGLGVLWFGVGDGVCPQLIFPGRNSQSHLLENGSTPASSWLQSGPVELIPEKTRLEANRFGRTAWPREMLANVITLFASRYSLEINLALSSSTVPSL